MYVIETKNLTKKYRDIYAVKNVNMHIEEGDIYGFVGENGAGKTTVIRLISGLASPTSGTYSIYGADWKDAKVLESRRKMGGIVETTSIIKSMTALENLQFQRNVCGSAKSDEELIAIIREVGLDYDAVKTRKAGNFSLGMRQRLGIAMTLVSDPKVIILDEPMNGLDPQGFVEIRETILRLNGQGITFFISSHILSELDKICNRIAFISHGELLEEVSMEDLHRQSRKRITICCEDTDALKAALEPLSLRDSEFNRNVCVIFDEVDVNDVMKALVDAGVKVQSFNLFEDTVEGHYFRLMAGRSVG